METFREWLEKTTIINEMSMNRKKAEDIVTSLSSEIYIHLLKVLVYKDEINYDKHCRDIDTWLNRIDNIYLKPSSKKPRRDDIYSWIFNDMYGLEKQVQQNIKKLDKDYGNLEKYDVSYNIIYNKLKNIYDKLSEDISNSNFKSIKDYI